MDPEGDHENNLRVVLCQVDPILGNPHETIKRLRPILERFRKEDKIDLILFPEMAFTGYNFSGSESASKLAVNLNEGEQFEFARELAMSLDSYVGFGYIQKVSDQSGTRLYNSAAFLNRRGEVVKNTKKSHLYYCDYLWAAEGPGFEWLMLSLRNGKQIKCGIGICMDINEKDFTSGDFELSNFLVKQNCKVLLFLTNWTSESKPSNEKALNEKEKLELYNYWMNRLLPLLKQNKNLLFLAADRVGVQHSFFSKSNCWFQGRSVGLDIQNGKPRIIKSLDASEQAVLQLSIPVQRFLV